MNPFKKTAHRLKPTLGHLMPSARESTLSFAAVWDPDKGLETYAGQDLLDQEAQKRPSFANVRDDEEPFAVFGTREPYFLDVRTSSAYERWVCGDSVSSSSSIEPPLHGSELSESTTLRSPQLITPRARQRPLRVDSTRANLAQKSVFIPTPSSKLTFAALWDPETGISAFQDGKQIKLTDCNNHTKWPYPSGSKAPLLHSQSLPPPPKPPLTLNLADFDYTKPGMYLPRSSAPCHGFRSAIPSSVIERERDPWNDNSFETLRDDEEPLNSTRPWSKLTQSSHSENTHQSVLDWVKRQGFTTEPSSVDDEGFFDASDHPDCEPHLPSRFSTTTTSTSTYVAIDMASVQPPTPLPLPPPPPPKHLSPGPPAFPTPSMSSIRSRLTKAKSFPDKLPEARRERKISVTPSVPKLPSVFKKTRVKGPIDDRWVMVEVRSVITERIVDD